MSEKYDSVPRDWWGDPKRIWQAQIKGEKNFDSYSFMGCLNDLQGDPNWREAFAGIETSTGMSEFMDRLQGHFNLCNPSQNPDGSFNVYQHPSRTKTSGDIDKKAMVRLTERHIKTLIKGCKLSEMEDLGMEISKHKVLWTDEPLPYFFLPWKEQQNADDPPKELYESDAWDFQFYMKRTNGNPYCFGIDRVPKILGDLEEAVYSLANDFGLRRYLMQSFFKPEEYGLDVNAQYELEWVHNCIFYFYENNCYVTKAPK